MKSPHTLIKLHARATCMLELIQTAEQYRDNLRSPNLNYVWMFGKRCNLEKKRISNAWKYRRIANYLKYRYANLLTKLAIVEPVNVGI